MPVDSSKPVTVPDGSPQEAPAGLRLEFCGNVQAIAPDRTFSIGREGHLVVDDNPYLHRRFLDLRHHDRFWWLSNVGNHLSATVSDEHGVMTTWLSPGATMPLVFAGTEVRFTAGPTAYLLRLDIDSPTLDPNPTALPGDGSTTVRPVRLTENQHRLVLALAEPALLAGATTAGTIPSSQAAAQRLGWTITKFNRQLDAVCEKLARGGIRGLHGDVSRLASGRRGRLVEYAVASRIVTVHDLARLDEG